MVKLSDVCSFYSGTGFPKNYQGKVTGKYPFYKVGDISKNVLQGNIRLVNAENYIDDIVVKSIKGTIIPKNTIVFAKIGEALKLNRRAITNCNCLIDNNVIGVKPNDEVLSINYFYYFMCSLKMENISEATTIPSVKKSNLEKININVPSFKEQEHISSTISKVDSLINLCKKQLSKLDELIKSRFVEMFGDPCAYSNCPNSIKLSECTIINPKKVNDLRLIDDLKVSFIPMSYVSDAGYIETSCVKTVNEVKKGFTYFAENDVLFAKITPCMENGKGAIAKNLINEIGFGSTEFHIIRPVEGVTNPYWIYYLTTFNEFRIDASIHMTGSAGQRRVPVSFLENYKVILPPIELQNEFAEFVEQVEKSKKEIQQSLEKLETLKKSLMQEYFG